MELNHHCASQTNLNKNAPLSDEHIWAHRCVTSKAISHIFGNKNTFANVENVGLNFFYLQTLGNGFDCNDINECMTSNGGCNSTAVCSNTPGSRKCACMSGYLGDGLTCANVNECLIANGGCSSNANCTDTEGSRSCQCISGYTGINNSNSHQRLHSRVVEEECFMIF